MAALPPNSDDAKLPVLWALHCAMENGEFFFRYLDAARMAHKLHIAIIAPSLGNGFFLNTAYEAQGDFLEELRQNLPSILNISKAREKNAVLGISMGGFGAIRWALESPHFFGAAAISGVFDASLPVDERALRNEQQNFIQKSFDSLMRARLTDPAGQLPYGGSLKGLVENHQEGFPQLDFYCGREDYLSMRQTEEFYLFCKRHKAHCSIYDQLSGGHNLEFWQKTFPEAAQRLFPQKDQQII